MSKTNSKHVKQCTICNHPQKEDIDLDYLHCIPWLVIHQRYNIGTIDSYEQIIRRHIISMKLREKRDRKNFYWRMIENAPFEKITMENALEASKQLDRIEHKVESEVQPSNIQVVYSFGGASGVPSDGKQAVKDSDRLQSVTDADGVSPKREEV